MQNKEIVLDNLDRFQNFIIFDPASARVNESDILLQGDDIKVFYAI